MPLFICTEEFFNLGLESPITDKSMIYEMDHICFDVDNFYDLEYLEYLVENKKNQDLI